MSTIDIQQIRPNLTAQRWELEKPAVRQSFSIFTTGGAFSFTSSTTSSFDSFDSSFEAAGSEPGQRGNGEVLGTPERFQKQM
jgi:hypothetical protein